jgi:hypothetical protein
MCLDLLVKSIGPIHPFPEICVVEPFKFVCRCPHQKFVPQNNFHVFFCPLWS